MPKNTFEGCVRLTKVELCNVSVSPLAQASECGRDLQCLTLSTQATHQFYEIGCHENLECIHALSVDCEDGAGQLVLRATSFTIYRSVVTPRSGPLDRI